MTEKHAIGVDLLDELRRHRLVAIVRGTDPVAAVRAGVTLVEAGVRLVEVSLTSRNAYACIEELASELAGSSALMGAGTVVAPGEARRCRDAGAAFSVTPALGPGVEESVAAGLPVLAGALTPTEVLAAHRAGAAAVKVFPASVFGPSYFSALAAPLPDVPLVAVGGVAAADVAGYLDAGAVGVGVASPLLGDAADGGDLRALTRRAADFLEAVGHGG